MDSQRNSAWNHRREWSKIFSGDPFGANFVPKWEGGQGFESGKKNCVDYASDSVPPHGSNPKKRAVAWISLEVG